MQGEAGEVLPVSQSCEASPSLLYSLAPDEMGRGL
jgi:hypothetical protein